MQVLKSCFSSNDPTHFASARKHLKWSIHDEWKCADGKDHGPFFSSLSLIFQAQIQFLPFDSHLDMWGRTALSSLIPKLTYMSRLSVGPCRRRGARVSLTTCVKEISVVWRASQSKVWELKCKIRSSKERLTKCKQKVKEFCLKCTDWSQLNRGNFSGRSSYIQILENTWIVMCRFQGLNCICILGKALETAT